jgi:hypothetical protein
MALLETVRTYRTETVQVAGDASTLPSAKLRVQDKLVERGRAMAAKTETGAFVRAASLENLRQRGRLAVRVGGHSLALFFEEGKI